MNHGPLWREIVYYCKYHQSCITALKSSAKYMAEIAEVVEKA